MVQKLSIASKSFRRFANIYALHRLGSFKTEKVISLPHLVFINMFCFLCLGAQCYRFVDHSRGFRGAYFLIEVATKMHNIGVIDTVQLCYIFTTQWPKKQMQRRRKTKALLHQHETRVSEKIICRLSSVFSRATYHFSVTSARKIANQHTSTLIIKFLLPAAANE